MMKKVICFLSAISLSISAAISLSSFSVYAEESSPDYYLYDESGKLSSSDFELIETQLESTAEYIGYNVAVYIGGDYRSDAETERFVKNSTVDMYGYQSGSVFYYIDCEGSDSAYDYMYVLGDAQLYYTDSDNESSDAGIYDCRIDFITHDNISYFTKGYEDLAGAIDNFCSNLEYYKDLGMVKGAWYYDKIDDNYHYATSSTNIKVQNTEPRTFKQQLVLWTVPLVLAIIAFCIVFFSVKSRYKFKTTPSASIYAPKENTNITNQQDIFIRKYTTKTKIERSTSSGGGSGGGSHSGGGSGGGCHR